MDVEDVVAPDVRVGRDLGDRLDASVPVNDVAPLGLESGLEDVDVGLLLGVVNEVVLERGLLNGPLCSS